MPRSCPPNFSLSLPQFEWQALEVAYQNKYGNDELYWDSLFTRPSAADGIQALERCALARSRLPHGTAFHMLAHLPRTRFPSTLSPS